MTRAMQWSADVDARQPLKVSGAVGCTFIGSLRRMTRRVRMHQEAVSTQGRAG